MLVASEEPSADSRRGIQERLGQPLPRRRPAPRILALATVFAALLVGALAVAEGLASSDSDDQVSAIAPAVSGDSTLDPVPDRPLDAPALSTTSRVYFAPGYEAEPRRCACRHRDGPRGHVGRDSPAGRRFGPVTPFSTRSATVLVHSVEPQRSQLL